jgi:hypothetical protein
MTTVPSIFYLVTLVCNKPFQNIMFCTADYSIPFHCKIIISI